MRYTKDEETILVGHLPTSGTVTIKLINLADDTELTVDDNTCTESLNIPGVYTFNLSHLNNVITEYTNCLYEMTDGTKQFYGKFVVSGYVEMPEFDELIDFQKGDWKMESVDVDGTGIPMMVFFRTDGTELSRYKLYDSVGNPSFEAFSRERVIV